MVPIYLIHPAVVHFPIVLFILVLVFDGIIIARGGDLTARVSLPTTAFWLTWAGVIASVVAAVFGDIAMDHAAKAGLPTEHIEEHAGFAMITQVIFFVLAIGLSVLRWKNISLAGIRGGLFTAGVLVGVVFVTLTAYHGGHLVYEMGINVRGVSPMMATDLAAQHEMGHEHGDGEHHDHHAEASPQPQ